MCVYVCMYMYVLDLCCLNERRGLCICKRMCVYVCVYVYVRMLICVVSMHDRGSACVYACVCVCMYVYVHI